MEYAEDIVLKAEDKAGMEELLRITKQCGRERKMRFGTGKCRAMVEFNNKATVSGSWRTLIEVVEKCTYLGLEINKEGVSGNI